MELKSLGERIRYVQHLVGGSGNLEALTGASPSQQSKIIREDVKNPGILLMAKIAKAGGVSLDWLATGEGEPDNAGAGASGYVALPFVGAETKPPFLFEKNYLVNRLSVTADKAVMYQETGDSMEPEISRGTFLVINTARKAGDAMYLMRFKGNDQLFLRYIQANPVKKCLSVTAANSHYASYDLQLEDIEIIGLPIWFGTN